MERSEIDRRVAEQKEKLTSSLDTHIAALEKLATTTNFDFDVATDVHPHLIEDSVLGKEQLKKWQDLYTELAKGPRALVTLRWNNGLVPGCYGFGAEPKHETNGLWLHVYEGVTQEDINFVKATDNAPSQVVINKPHTVKEWWSGRRAAGGTAYDTNSAALYSQDRRTVNEKFTQKNAEQFASNELLVCHESLRGACNAVDRLIDDRLSLDARFVVSDFMDSKVYFEK